MRTNRSRVVAFVAMAACVAVLVAMAIHFPGAVLEPWYLDQLGSDFQADRDRAVEKLQDLKSRELIPRLIELPARDADKFNWAVQKLVEIGEAAVPHLKTALKDEKQVIRRCALRAFDDIDRAAANAGLIEAVESDDLDVQIHALSALTGRPSAEAIPVLLRTMSHSHPGVRRSAVNALGRAGNRAVSAIPVLRERLKDTDRSVRRAVVGALRHFAPWRGKEVAPLFVHALGDEDEEVRRAAALGLKEIGVRGENVLSALRDTLNDESRSVRSAAESALETLRGTP